MGAAGTDATVFNVGINMCLCNERCVLRLFSLSTEVHPHNSRSGATEDLQTTHRPICAGLCITVHQPDIKKI